MKYRNDGVLVKTQKSNPDFSEEVSLLNLINNFSKKVSLFSTICGTYF